MGNILRSFLLCSKDFLYLLDNEITICSFKITHKRNPIRKFAFREFCITWQYCKNTIICIQNVIRWYEKLKYNKYKIITLTTLPKVLVDEDASHHSCNYRHQRPQHRPHDDPDTASFGYVWNKDAKRLCTWTVWLADFCLKRVICINMQRSLLDSLLVLLMKLYRYVYMCCFKIP